MRRTRAAAVLLSTLLGLLLSACLREDAITVVDLSLLQGVWEGTYEYLDYQSDAERIQLPARLVVTLRGAEAAGPAEALFAFTYRQPTGATTTEESILHYFPNELLVEYRGNWAITEAAADAAAASLRLVFTGNTEDDGRDALVRQTIERAGDALTLRKEVRYEGNDEFITRGEHRLVLAGE